MSDHEAGVFSRDAAVEDRGGPVGSPQREAAELRGAMIADTREGDTTATLRQVLDAIREDVRSARTREGNAEKELTISLRALAKDFVEPIQMHDQGPHGRPVLARPIRRMRDAARRVLMSKEQSQPEIIANLLTTVARLAETFASTGDVTTTEFMTVSKARDDLNEVIRQMYETCIYKDD